MLPSQQPGSTAPPKEIPKFFLCPACDKSLNLSDDFIVSHFLQKTVSCRSCGLHFTPWEVALKTVREHLGFTLFYAIGARTTVFDTKILQNTQTHFDLHEAGIPRDSIILDVNFTPEGMFCTEMTGNSRRLRNRGGMLQLYGFHLYNSPKPELQEATVHICVTWVASSRSDVAWNNLVSAFDAYAAQDFQDVVIPANVAVEAKLFGFVEQMLKAVASKDRIADFLQSAATYSYQLNILLPLLVRSMKLPQFDPNIRGLLNALRDARNSVAHRGYCEPTLTKDRTAELLTAALFGFRYLDYLVECDFDQIG